MAGTSTASSSALTVPNSELKEIMLRMETSLTGRIDKIQERLDNMSITVKDNETKIKVIEEGLNAQVRDTQLIEQDTIPKLKKKTKDRFEELEHKLKLSEIRDRRYNLLFYGAAESDKPVNEVV